MLKAKKKLVRKLEKLIRRTEAEPDDQDLHKSTTQTLKNMIQNYSTVLQYSQKANSVYRSIGIEFSRKCSLTAFQDLLVTLGDFPEFKELDLVVKKQNVVNFMGKLLQLVRDCHLEQKDQYEIIMDFLEEQGQQLLILFVRWAGLTSRQTYISHFQKFEQGNEEILLKGYSQKHSSLTVKYVCEMLGMEAIIYRADSKKASFEAFKLELNKVENPASTGVLITKNTDCLLIKKSKKSISDSISDDEHEEIQQIQTPKQKQIHFEEIKQATLQAAQQSDEEQAAVQDELTVRNYQQQREENSKGSLQERIQCCKERLLKKKMQALNHLSEEEKEYLTRMWVSTLNM